MKKRYSTLLLVLLPLPVISSPQLHRAVEPATANIDINISRGHVTIFMDINAESTAHMTPQDGSPAALIAPLKKAGQLGTPDKNSQCYQTGFHIHHLNLSIKGFQSFSCSYPELLSHIDLNLFGLIPELQTINLWLITEHWQNKQLLGPAQSTVSIRQDLKQ